MELSSLLWNKDVEAEYGFNVTLCSTRRKDMQLLGHSHGNGVSQIVRVYDCNFVRSQTMGRLDLSLNQPYSAIGTCIVFLIVCTIFDV